MVQSQISKQDGQIKSLQAERTSLSAQLEDVRANLHAATSLADQQVGINITAFLSVTYAFTLLYDALVLRTSYVKLMCELSLWLSPTVAHCSTTGKLHSAVCHC